MILRLTPYVHYVPHLDLTEMISNCQQMTNVKKLNTWSMSCDILITIFEIGKFLASVDLNHVKMVKFCDTLK